MLRAIFLVLLLLPSAYALTCDGLVGNELNICTETIQSNVSMDEQQQLIAALYYPSKYYANHSFVEDWNTNIEFNEAPYEIQTESNGYIKDAWLKIVAVMPSILVNNTLLSPGIGILQSAFNYRVEIPTGTEPGDCRTDYNLQSEQNWLNNYLNDNLIGTSTLTNFTGSGILDFQDTLRIQTITRVDHWTMQQYCCRSERNICVEWCEECRQANTEYRTHEVNLQDEKTALEYSPEIMPEIRVIDKYLNTTVGLLNISNFDAFTLAFDDSYFRQNNYNYDVNVSLQPYDVFTIRANRFQEQKVKNLNIEQFNDTYKFYVSDPSQCEIRFNDHFNSWSESCDLSYTPIPFSIKTDKLQYKENETINITLEPKDTQIKVRYGEEEILAQNNAQFNAKPNLNKITAYFNDRKTEEIIHVKRKNVWALVVNFSVFSGVMYSVFLLIKKYAGFFL